MGEVNPGVTCLTNILEHAISIFNTSAGEIDCGANPVHLLSASPVLLRPGISVVFLDQQDINLSNHLLSKPLDNFPYQGRGGHVISIFNTGAGEIGCGANQVHLLSSSPVLVQACGAFINV